MAAETSHLKDSFFFCSVPFSSLHFYDILLDMINLNWKVSHSSSSSSLFYASFKFFFCVLWSSLFLIKGIICELWQCEWWVRSVFWDSQDKSTQNLHSKWSNSISVLTWIFYNLCKNMIYLGHSWGAVVSKKNYNNWLPLIVWLNAKTGTKKKKL